MAMERRRSRSRVNLARVIIGLLGYGLAGCGQPEDDVSMRVSEMSYGAALSLGTSATYWQPGPGRNGRRWVGKTALLKGCPIAPAPWRTEDVFPGQYVPGYLRSYCAYIWDKAQASPNENDIGQLHQNLGGSIVDWTEDSVVVGPLAPHGVQRMRMWLRESFYRRVARLSPLPTGSVPFERVRMAMIDSSPDDTSGFIPLGNLDHGYLLSWMAQDLTCPTLAGCAADVYSFLTLPMIDNDHADWTRGGYFGTRMQLAQAIYRAVESWKNDREFFLTHGSGVDHPRLVVNASVGFEPHHSCEPDPSTDSATAAVHEALVHAHCYGALVVAAAGNDTGGPNPGKCLVYPAAWSQDDAPNEEMCLALEGPDYANKVSGGLPLVSDKDPARLVTAVGGLDYADRPIARSREHALPRLSALGLLGTSGEAGTPLPPARTGTSLAAVTASAVAATLWAYNPKRTAHQVATHLEASGRPVQVPPGYCVDPAFCTSSAISLCKAVSTLCAADKPATCPAAGVTCDGLPEIGMQNPNVPPNVAFPVQSEFAQAPLIPTLGASLHPAPEDLWPSIAVPPRVSPQPDRPPCGSCVFSSRIGLSDGRLHVEVDGMTALTMPTLTLTGMNGSTSTSLVYSWNVPIVPGQPLTFEGIASAGWTSITSATLSFVSDGNGSVTEQIVIDHD